MSFLTGEKEKERCLEEGNVKISQTVEKKPQPTHLSFRIEFCRIYTSNEVHVHKQVVGKFLKKKSFDRSVVKGQPVKVKFVREQ